MNKYLEVGVHDDTLNRESSSSFKYLFQLNEPCILFGLQLGTINHTGTNLYNRLLMHVTEALMIFSQFFFLNRPEVDLRRRQEFVTYDGGR